jgi:hypothetical protein
VESPKRRLALQLLHDINFYRAYTKHIVELREQKPVSDYAPQEKRLKMLEDLISWCQEKKVQPRFWIYHLFAARRWLFPPKMEKGHLFSERMLKSYRFAKPTDFYEQRLRQTERERQELEGLTRDPNLKLTEGVETAKRTYAGTRSWTRCMDDLTTTYGYHPHSEVCQRCPLAKRCEEKVRDLFPFDIMAARRGDIEMTTRKAREAVWRSPYAPADE